MSAYVITTDEQRIELDTPVTLEAAQAAVGGYIEFVPEVLFNGKIDGESAQMICDEEGKLKGKPINAWATVTTKGREVVVGDVVVLTGNDRLD